MSLREAFHPENIRILPIDKSINLTSFTCTEPELNDFLKTDALNDHENLYSITRIICYDKTIIGFFTLIADNISVKTIPENEYSDYHYNKLPAVKIARLAVDKNYEHKGIGTLIITEILSVVNLISDNVGCRIITVDAKENALGFYRKFTFREVISKKNQEYIPMYLDFLNLKKKAMEK
ncbi:MAG TPA: GNAT family N-acetyltransferase [Methanocorpusculum sp.]|nr:GNAT family N-acetyltransferase [Methanocorpusculum sp.]